MECHVLAINMATFLADTRTPSLPPQIRNPIISSSVLYTVEGIISPLKKGKMGSPVFFLLFLFKKKGEKWNKNIYLQLKCKYAGNK